MRNQFLTTGVAPLAKAFPLLMKLVGVSFAVTFIIFRVILWPYVSIFFWKDSFELLKQDLSKFDQEFVLDSKIIIYIFMVINFGLTLLQFFWLIEIFQTAGKVLGGDGDLSIKRGEDKNVNIKKLK